MIRKDLVRLMMDKVWRVSKPMEFHEIEGNYFVITFANQSDRNRVLDGCPWLFDNLLFMMKMFDGMT